MGVPLALLECGLLYILMDINQHKQMWYIIASRFNMLVTWINVILTLVKAKEEAAQWDSYNLYLNMEERGKATYVVQSGMKEKKD